MITLEDHQIRVKMLFCCIGNKGDALASKLRLGKQCQSDILQLELLTAFLDILYCYDPTNTDECLTQTEIDSIWDYVSKCCGICFLPYGTNYTQLLAQQQSQGILLQESGNRLLQENNGLLNI